MRYDACGMHSRPARAFTRQRPDTQVKRSESTPVKLGMRYEALGDPGGVSAKSNAPDMNGGVEEGDSEDAPWRVCGNGCGVEGRAGRHSRGREPGTEDGDPGRGDGGSERAREGGSERWMDYIGFQSWMLVLAGLVPAPTTRSCLTCMQSVLLACLP